MRFLAVLFLCLLIGTLPSHAAPLACNAGAEGTIIYNKDHKIVQFCDGTQWIGMVARIGDDEDTLGELSCANGEIAKFNGTTWACAADGGGTLPGLASASIWVGNAGGAATAVAMSGDATLSNVGVLNLGSGVVTTTEILDATILAADLADDAVTIPKLAATGTASATTFLRGDNTWATIGASLPALTSASIWVGNGSNVATAVAMSGDATMTNAGVLSLAANSVANAEMADDAVGLAELSATGTPSATTYLRGDNTWATVSAVGDDLGNHTATQALNMGGFAINNAGAVIGTSGQFARPTDHWSGSGFFGVGSLGQLDTHGAYEVTLTSNGYRNSSSQWVSYGANSNTGAAQIRLNPAGSIVFATDAAKATGSAAAITSRLTIDAAGAITATGAITASSFSGSGASLTSLPAANLTGTLPAISGANLTNLDAADLATGSVPAARMPALTGDVTMTAGTTTTALAADTVGLAELSATGTPSATTYLRGDNTWGTVSGDNLGAGGTTAGTLYSSNASGYGYMGSEGGTTGAYMRFDGDPAASAGRIYVNLLGTWEYLFHSDYFAPYATNVNDLGNSSVRWADGWFAGTVTAGTFAGSGASLTALNATNLASGTVPAARLPAYTGDVTKAAGGTVLTIAAGAVTATELASDAVTNAKVAADAIGIAELSATGTPGATTFLRGDNTWATAGGGGADPGTLCGIARKSGCDISCSDNTSPAYTSVSTCNGASVVSSCPSGYTLRTTAWTTMTSCGDSNSYLACMRNCSKN